VKASADKLYPKLSAVRKMESPSLQSRTAEGGTSETAAGANNQRLTVMPPVRMRDVLGMQSKSKKVGGGVPNDRAVGTQRTTRRESLGGTDKEVWKKSEG